MAKKPRRRTLKGFDPSRTAERDFFRALKKVAHSAGHIIDVHQSLDSLGPDLTKALRSYADKIGPWAAKQSQKLLDKVQRQNYRAYKKQSEAIGVALKLNLKGSHVVGVAARLMLEQVELIKSIPLEAGVRVQELAFKNALTGGRASFEEVQKQIGLSTEVATARAELIARTETARATASINQARAMSVGSRQYRWRNSGDSAVRHSHKTYKGKPIGDFVFSWDDPPTLSDGMTGHPGTFPNCRCYAEPIFGQ